MFSLDIRTIALLIAFISALQAMVIVLCYFTSARYPGLTWWSVGGITNSIGWLLLVFRDVLPDFVTIVVANTCLVYATFCLYQGLNRFLGVRYGAQTRLAIVVTLVCVLSLIFFTYSAPSIGMRTLFTSTTVALVACFCAWNLWRTPHAHLRISASSAATVLTLYSAWYAWRALFTLLFPSSPTLFGPTLMQVATLLVTLGGIILWSASFVTMVIQRQHADLIAAQSAERKGLETAYQHVRAREQLFRLTFEQSPVGAALISREQRFTRANTVLCALLGYDEADLLNQHIVSILHPDERDSNIAQLQALADGHIAHLALEQRWCGHDDTVVWVQVSARMMQYDPDAEPAMLLKAIDISARKFAEEALRERETMLNAISSNLPETMVYQLKRTPDGHEQFTYLSGTLLQSSGMTPEQVYDDVSVLESLHDPEGLTHYHAAVEHSFQTLELFNYELQKHLPSGETRWSLLRSRPRRIADGSTIWDGIEVDITERKQVETHLRQRIDELLSLNWITQVLAGWTDLPESLKSVAGEIQALFKASTVAMWVYEGNDTLRCLVSLSVTGARTLADTIAVSASELAQRLRAQETVLLPRTTDDPLLSSAHTLPNAQQCICVVPLVTHGETLGLMLICARQPNNVYTPADVALAQTIVAPLAIAIENARLFSQVQTSAAEAERRRLGRELHDSVSQALFAAHRTAEVLPQLWELDPEEGAVGLQEIRRLTHSALTEMRTLLLELRPQALRDLPLHIALQDLLQGLAVRQSIHLDVLLEVVPVLSPEVQVALYRIAQEALNNVSKHARAHSVVVRLSAQPSVIDPWRGTITLVINDDGCGFDVGRTSAGRMGLTSLRERAAEIGATLVLESAPETGTHIMLVWHGAAAEPRSVPRALVMNQDGKQEPHEHA